MSRPPVSRPPAASLPRRTLAKGAAWTLPVLTAGALAPLAAASVGPVQPTETGSDSCKWAGNGGTDKYDKVFRAKVCWYNSSSTPLTVTIINTAISGGDCPREIVYESTTFVVAAGATVCKFIYFRADSSGNRSLTMTYLIAEIPGRTFTDTIGLGFSANCPKDDPVPYTGAITPCP